ncbi:hypothetical protein PN462_01015 [Spirulina sp. CS-785/01]|uniref:hypothetical protein n=1 Tax=Spirulina sp. CS-785/01 TaxID=3021716 RepID=UPI00232D9CB6|nr:hypothetical protein [Spirulina sp. CS-785/01]MDB9311663.1 hypothetical protein [Spirulina sp. CS-785/01]
MSENGKLIHRRVLLHSHVEEQPFTRSSSPVAIQPNQPVTVRVHMNNTGYSPQAMQGTVQEGFTSVQLPENFAASLADENPLPENCAF